MYDAETSGWVFRFGPEVALRVAAPWRLIGEGAIELGYEDHGQRFGQQQPLDGAVTATRLLRSRIVESFSVAEVSADASIDFGGGYQLQVFNASSGYEGWTLGHIDGRQVVAQGGGHVVTFSEAGQ
jgi:hypothetical protein